MWPGSIEQLLSTPKMSIQNPQPPQINGKIYPFLGFSLAMSTTPVNGVMQLNIAVTLTPYRECEGVIETLQEGTIIINFGDALSKAQVDPYLWEFLEGLELLSQEYVNRNV